ncbi:Dihydrofolate reductase [Agromyces sp. CF514]|uniref:dihydrofolate reductase family protein n=1 Tax=Agromyces sp. CF514 TaxID=1881031 RepID=UPI0008EB1525|nr:dihydrofolate reductase family protein [Agromyces sp. CF514]SFR71066.1 Dihydrofolate reductase [Agromyces sp. CF514]
MKLVTNTQITVDGVMQANGGNNPELDPGFDRGGWAIPLGDEESVGFIGDCYLRADAFLFGRRTYDLFASYWGVQTDLESPFVRSLNTRPKFVASDTITDPQWADTTVLPGRGADGEGRELEAAIRALKARPGGELQVHGSGQLIRWLLERELVDEMVLIVCPVIVGAGKRLFPEEGRDVALELLESRTFPTGIVAQTYRPGGRPQYA